AYPATITGRSNCAAIASAPSSALSTNPQNSKIRNQYGLELPSGKLSVVFPICHRINVDRSWTNSNLQRSLYIPNNGNSPKLTG
ncbi:MAG: hypothetical protein WB691_26875, partial [Pseudolabrys sp.]